MVASDTSLSPHDSTSLIKSGGNLSKGRESVWQREQILIGYNLLSGSLFTCLVNCSFDDLQNSN